VTRTGRRLCAATRISLLSAVAAAGCSTAPGVPEREVAPVPHAPVESAATAPVAPTFWEWERTTRDRADALVDEAQRLAAAGDLDAALERLDTAMDLIRNTPEGYVRRDAWHVYMADLEAEAERLSARYEPGTDAARDAEVADLPELPPPHDERTDWSADGLPPSDYPLVRNATVERFLDAFSRPGEYRTRIERGLERAGPYLPMIRDEFASAGVPQDLAWLPLIESSFSLTATSRARAHGMWQFMASTGRHYGLRVDGLVDERRDPVLATRAAAAYLADLHAEFGDWHLALAAYNSGAGNVRRAIRRTGSTDFWTLQRRLPRETRSYVPAFIASVIVATDPARLGLPTPVPEPWALEPLQIPEPLDLAVLAKHMGTDTATLRATNPALRRDLTPAGRPTVLWLPPDDAASARAVLAELPRSEWAPRMLYTVRSGDTLSGIASRHGSSVSAIRAANDIRGSLIRPGQELIVPRFGLDAPPPPARREAPEGTYVVRSADTLWDIARSFGIRVAQLCEVNGIGPDDPIFPGQRLRIPQPPRQG
jgi:membrane-bound lytic murein transglycosylase D